MSESMTLRIIARLMAYPEQALLDSLPEMIAALREEKRLPPPLLARLEKLMTALATQNLFDLQEHYVTLFDRGRALSLHLFEHVHGESRDRGQAMVDLLELYRAGGLELAARELPDYLPLMLEYLSTRPHPEAQELLGDAMAVIVLLGARLAERGSDYALLFEALEALAGSPAGAEQLRRMAATEGPDETIEKMDEIWAEEAITFTGNGDPSAACATAYPQAPASGSAIPVRILEEPADVARTASGKRR